MKYIHLVPIMLYFLSSVDATYAGYRAAAGRNALICKEAYYRRAMLQGALLGQIAVATSAAAIGFALWVSHDQASLLAALFAAGLRMLYVYLPYALVIGAAFVLRSIPSVDIRSFLSSLIFGPLTLLRPLAAAAGIAWAILAAPCLAVAIIGLMVLTLMLLVEPFLYWKEEASQSHPE